MKPDTPESDSQQDLKRRARRRLFGAAFFVIIVAALLPLAMDAAPPPQLNDFRIVTDEEKRAAAVPIIVPPPEAVPASAGPAAPAVIKEAVTETAKPADSAASAPTAPTAPVVVASAPVETKAATPVVEKKPEPVKPAEKPAVKPTDKAVEKKAVEKSAEKKPADKPADAKKESKDAKEPVQTGQFYIQVGVFADSDNVKQVRTKLSAQGIASWTEAATGNLAGKTRVKAGPFASKEAADKALAKISKAGLNGLVVKK